MDSAVSAAWKDIYRPQAGVVLHPAALGRLPTRQDVVTTARVLACAVAAGSTDYFVAYVRSIVTEQAARGAPPLAMAAVIAALRRYYAEALPPALAALVLSVLDAGLDAVSRPGPDLSGPVAALVAEGSAEPFTGVEALADALLAGEIDKGRRLLRDAVGAGRPCVEVATGLLQPALYTVGHRWQQRRITVAEEHGATAVAAALLAELFADAPRAAPLGRTALIAGVTGNRHALGPHLVADALDVAGWDARFLGGDASVDAVVAEVDRCRPDLLGLSASMPDQVPAMYRIIRQVRRTFGSAGPRIVIGGLATNHMRALWRWIGADGWSPDATTAVALVGG
ncbi:MAG: hypothetical protein EA406_08715 [Rhodospirillales bacterium]|nr:MAG: hypothetical protein EA406_08715 [Rhodospirillales bacterium]